MGLLASADVTLLSDKWRKTAILIVLSLCVTAIGIAAFLVTKEIELAFGTLGILFAVNRKAVGLDEGKLKKIIEATRKKTVKQVGDK